MKNEQLGFAENESLENLIINYLDTLDSNIEFKSFEIISKIIKTTSNYSIEEYSKLMIIKPMKLNLTTLDSYSIITTQNDYFKLCNAICNYGITLSRIKNLEESINILASYIKKTNKGHLSYIDKSGVFTYINTKYKILSIYNQIPTTIDDNQYEMFDRLQTLIYDCFVKTSLSKGYNLFP